MSRPRPRRTSRPSAPTTTVSSYDREERQSLRRVAGMSTELTDITEVEYRQLLLERVVLVSVWTTGSEVDAENAMAELKLLAETAGSRSWRASSSAAQRPDPATYIGRGKVEELREVVVATGADTVICDGELAPAQLRNLEDRVKVKVIDRTSLILDIFAAHAKSAEGQGAGRAGPAAVPQAATTRLGWQPLPAGRRSRQRRGRHRRPWARRDEAGDRPAPDQQPDREAAGRRCARWTRTGETKRAERRRHQVPSVAIVGYTNAGKSSVLNRLTGAGVLVEDALFATLDPTTRRTADRGWPGLHADRHRRFRPASAARSGRGVRLDAGGVGPGRPAGARGRWVRSRPGRSDQSRPRVCWPTSAPATCPS